MGVISIAAAALLVGTVGFLWRATRADRPARRAAPSDRWEGYPKLARLIVVAVHLVPISLAVAATSTLSRRLSEPQGTADTIGRWSLLLAVSTLVLVVTDRMARRALPIAALLKLSMVFPDRAPRRLAVARRAGSTRNLERRLAEAKALGSDDEPARAAEVILSLVAALHGHDRHTRGHSERVRWFADLIADELRLPEADRDRLRWAALLHDIGKLHVRRRILNKPGQLTPVEWRHIHRHPEEGARITSSLAPWLGDWSLTIVQHHERYDGTGYPVGLRGDEISYGARIVAVADAFEVMTAVRAYKKANSAADARRELARCAGEHFDPAIVKAFLQISVGRLRWVAGPAAWLAQLPFIGWVPRLADGAAALTGQAAGVAGAAAGAAAVTTAGTVAVPPESDRVVPSNPPVLLEIPTTPLDGATSRPPEVLGTQVVRANAPTTTTTTALPNGKVAPGQVVDEGAPVEAAPASAPSADAPERASETPAATKKAERGPLITIDTERLTSPTGKPKER